MSRRVSSTALRLNLNKSWKSLWYAEGKMYRDQLHQDIELRDIISDRLRSAGLDTVEIARSHQKVIITVYVSRPGVAIGRGGEGIDRLKSDLIKKFNLPLEIKIHEVKNPDLSARVLARNIADGIERRQSPKRMMIAEKEKAMQAGAKGIRIVVGGRIGGNDIARTIVEKEGSVPLQTLRADIDYASEVAATKNAGLIGVKVWVFRSDSEDKEDK
ncbi:MAG: 30S ribosomal protein S3 [Patescibacteria group bacterium]|nr:30S ribosomal protein S3 [Patescibacteria group bacterium]